MTGLHTKFSVVH